ncbi:unnamed protein product [Periconia digitata]|uniref:Uncharacterized protein n=1 Tax=Periconia digitata TaxID=1303443 RepID=A0A9W4U5S6_9PLEO|nr:unnamed protein product [Periconia digitata]
MPWSGSSGLDYDRDVTDAYVAYGARILHTRAMGYGFYRRNMCLAAEDGRR